MERVLGYIAAPGSIYALYVERMAKFPPFGRISVIQNSILGPPMVYITHISSKYSIFKTLRVNGSMDTCLILVSIEYLRVFVLVLRANTCEYEYSDIREYSPSKYSCECEYRIPYVREYSYSQIHTHSIPWVQSVCSISDFAEQEQRTAILNGVPDWNWDTYISSAMNRNNGIIKKLTWKIVLKLIISNNSRLKG
jgi:hypothetical protein